jgi:RNA polymerase sigma factor (sigma-70 family)
MKDQGKQDSICINLFLTGNQKGFDRLYKKYEKPLFSYIFKYTHNRQTAEDIFQKTWFKVIRGLKNYTEKGSFGSWLFGIAHNNCIDHYRKQAKKEMDDNISEEGMDSLKNENAENPENQFIKQEGINRLKRAIQTLPNEQKQVVLLRLYADLTFKEIAEKCECSLNTVLGRMHYAVGNLKKIVNKERWEDLENDVL